MCNRTIRMWSGLSITIVIFSTIHVRTSFALGTSTEAPSTKIVLTKSSFTQASTTNGNSTGVEYCHISFTIINRSGRRVGLHANFDGRFRRIFRMINGTNYTDGRRVKGCGNFTIIARHDMKTTVLKICIIAASKRPIQGPISCYIEAPPQIKTTSTEAPFTYTSSTNDPTMNVNMTVTRTPSETPSPSPLSNITSEANTTREDTAQNISNNKNTKNNMSFYVAFGVGSVISLALSIIFYVLVKRKIRKNAESRKRAKYWAKINRTCASQYVGNEEVATDNPMYEGSRSRTTSNVLYGVPDDGDNDVGNESENKPKKYLLSAPSQQEPELELVIGNACALYQNADDIYSEPTRASTCMDNGNYERIRSFIQTGNELKENSYAEPSVIFNGMVVSENTCYISSQRN